MLQEFIFPELTPLDKAFTAGYQAAEVLWLRMVRKGMTDPDEFISDAAYDHYMAALTEYTSDKEATSADNKIDGMKVIVAGSRSFDDQALMDKWIRRMKTIGIEEIVSGHAKGADACGELVALNQDINLRLFPADWNQHGKAAGPIRNREMADYADMAIVFWDGKSPGSMNMIEVMMARKKPVMIVPFKEKTDEKDKV